LVVDLGFSAVLVLVAEAIVLLARGSRFSVLVVVFVAGYSLRAMARHWRNRHARGVDGPPSEVTDTGGHAADG
jgi:hypothetical protein